MQPARVFITASSDIRNSRSDAAGGEPRVDTARWQAKWVFRPTSFRAAFQQRCRRAACYMCACHAPWLPGAAGARLPRLPTGHGGITAIRGPANRSEAAHGEVR